MTIDWTHFTPASALSGGVLIGLATALLLFFKGRIAGISGIVGGVLASANQGEAKWRLAFILGLVLAPVAYRLFDILPESRIDADWITLVIAGLLTGYGSRLGSGCTSGHGVCGISRLSLRSLVATLSFMSTGFVTVYVVRHLVT